MRLAWHPCMFWRFSGAFPGSFLLSKLSSSCDLELQVSALGFDLEREVAMVLQDFCCISIISVGERGLR